MLTVTNAYRLMYEERTLYYISAKILVQQSAAKQRRASVIVVT